MGFSVSMLYVFNIKTFTEEGEVYLAVVLIFLFYGFSVINFTYVFGFLFKEYGNA